MRWLALVLALALPLGAGCGGGGDETDESAPTLARAAQTVQGARPGAAIRVGLVTDVGGLDDRSFNFLAREGLERAEEELGVEGRVVVSRSDADYVPNLT